MTKMINETVKSEEIEKAADEILAADKLYCTLMADAYKELFLRTGKAWYLEEAVSWIEKAEG